MGGRGGGIVGLFLLLVLAVIAFHSATSLPSSQQIGSQGQHYEAAKFGAGTTSNGAALSIGGMTAAAATFLSTYKDEIGATSGAVAAIFTIILGIATWLLYGSTKGLVDTTVNGQRAYIFPGNPEPSLFPKDRILRASVEEADFRPKAHIDFINYGTSPAIIKRIRIELYIGESLPRFPIFRYSPTYIGDTVLAKESHSKVIECEYKDKLPDAKLLDMRSGRVGAWLFGFVEYEDIFGFIHRKGFCNDFPTARTISGIRETGGKRWLGLSEHPIGGS